MEEKPPRTGLKLSMLTQPQSHSPRPASDAPPSPPDPDPATSEAVHARAAFGPRLLAAAIDVIIFLCTLPLVGIFIAFTGIVISIVAGPFSGATFVAPLVALIWASGFAALQVTQEHRVNGTLGKKTFKLRMVDVSGEPPSLRQVTAHVLLRHPCVFLMPLLTELPGLICVSLLAAVAIIVVEACVQGRRQDGRTLVDLATGTKVVRVSDQHYYPLPRNG